MKSDSFYQIGASHIVCEDYARHGNRYAILSDGCSNGSDGSIDADWGARLLVHAAERYIGELHDSKKFLTSVWSRAEAQLDLFPHLRREALTATLLALRGDANNIVALAIGDGSIGALRRDGIWEFAEISFLAGGKSNSVAPFYPAYLVDDSTFASYIEFHGGAYIVKRWEIRTDGVFLISNITYNVAQSPYIECVFPKDTYQTVLITSDGIGSFIKKRLEPNVADEDIPAEQAFSFLSADLPAYDNFLWGQFFHLTERKKRGTFLLNGWDYMDDLSVAGLRYENND